MSADKYPSIFSRQMEAIVYKCIISISSLKSSSLYSPFLLEFSEKIRLFYFFDIIVMQTRKVRLEKDSNDIKSAVK